MFKIPIKKSYLIKTLTLFLLINQSNSSILTQKKEIPDNASIQRLNSSEISNLCASNNKIIRSTRSANHSRTPLKSYPRSNLCFSPDKIPKN